MRFLLQRLLDARVGLPLQRQREQHAGDGERHDRGGDPREEQLGLE